MPPPCHIQYSLWPFVLLHDINPVRHSPHCKGLEQAMQNHNRILRFFRVPVSFEVWSNVSGSSPTPRSIPPLAQVTGPAVQAKGCADCIMRQASTMADEDTMCFQLLCCCSVFERLAHPNCHELSSFCFGRRVLIRMIITSRPPMRAPPTPTRSRCRELKKCSRWVMQEGVVFSFSGIATFWTCWQAGEVRKGSHLMIKGRPCKFPGAKNSTLSPSLQL